MIVELHIMGAGPIYIQSRLIAAVLPRRIQGGLVDGSYIFMQGVAEEMFAVSESPDAVLRMIPHD